MSELPSQDPIMERLMSCMEGPVDEWPELVAQLCGEYPEQAARIQRSFQMFRDFQQPSITETTADGGPQVPEYIGSNRILKVLGEGGMGTVYLAEQLEPVHRQVALKVIRLGMDSRRILARFEAERQALAMMNHDNIARVFDAGTTSTGQPYFVMEHVPGIPLTDYCNARRLTIRERLELLVQVCSGIQHAHQKGIIHRDLKPGNILVSDQEGQPRVKIIDFGLARATDPQSTGATMHTMQGAVLGTPEYMSPEQAATDGTDVDTRTDVYALGVILYELLVGDLPIPRQRMRSAGLVELQRMICEVEPPRPSSRLQSMADAAVHAEARRVSVVALQRALRSDLDWIVMKALEKDRSRRYETARELALDIERHQAHLPVTAGPPGAGYRFAKLLRRRWRLVLSGTTVLVALLVGFAVSLVYYLQAVDLAESLRREALVGQAAAALEANSPQLATRLTVTAADMVGSKLAQYPDVVSALHTSVGRNHSRGVLAGHVRPVLFVSYVAGDRIVSATTRAIRVWGADRQCQAEILHPSGLNIEVRAVAPDGNRIAGADEAGRVFLWDLQGQLAHELVHDARTEGPRAIRGLAWHPSGAFLVSAGSDGKAKVWDPQTGALLRELDGFGAWVGAVACSVDGAWLAGVGASGRLRLWRVADWQLVDDLPHPGPAQAIVFSPRPDGDGHPDLVTIGTDQRAYLFRDGHAPAALHQDAGAGDTRCAVFSPDGRRIVLGMQDSSIQMWTATGEFRYMRRKHRNIVDHVAFRPDGRCFASASLDGTLRVWTLDGTDVLVLDGHDFKVRMVAFTADGKRLVSGSDDTDVREWDFLPPGVTLLFGHQQNVTYLEVAADGARMVTASTDRTVREWDRDGNLLRSLPHDDWVSCARYAAWDGRTILASGHDGLVWVWADEGDARPTKLPYPFQVQTTAITLRSYDAPRRVLTFSYDPKAQRCYLFEWRHQGGNWQAQEHPWMRKYPTNRVQFDADGRHVYLATDIGAFIATVDGSRIEKVFDGGAYSAARSPDGRYFFCGWVDGTIRIRDLVSGEVHELHGHDRTIEMSRFSADGRLLAVASGDKVSLWRTQDASLVTWLRGHEGLIRAVAFTPTGDRVFTLSTNHTVRGWITDVQVLLGVARSRMGEFSDLERQRFADLLPAGSGAAAGRSSVGSRGR